MANALMEFSNGLAATVELAGQSVVAVAEGGRNGVSGLVWHEGIAVTAEHTISGHDEVTLTLPSGSRSKARVLGRDPGTDVAVLKVNDNATPAILTDAAQVKVGHMVLAVGRSAEGMSASYGIVSALGGPWRTWQGGRVDQWLRLDLNPYPGFSGGSLVDLAGRVLGMNTSGPRRTVVTIPNATVDRVVRQVLQHGHVARGYLGLGVQAVTFPPALQHALGLKDDRGLLVVTLAADAPAEKAGVMIGDVIVSIDGVAAAAAGDLQAALEPEHVGKPVSVRLVRGGAATELFITVGERSGRRS